MRAPLRKIVSKRSFLYFDTAVITLECGHSSAQHVNSRAKSKRCNNCAPPVRYLEVEP